MQFSLFLYSPLSIIIHMTQHKSFPYFFLHKVKACRKETKTKYIESCEFGRHLCKTTTQSMIVVSGERGMTHFSFSPLLFVALYKRHYLHFVLFVSILSIQRISLPTKQINPLSLLHSVPAL